jgi:hypothetical protein
MTTPVMDPTTAAPRRGNTLVKIVLVIGCALMASMWIYFFFFATDEGVYQLQDPSWRATAQPICKAAQDQRNALEDTTGGFISNPTVEQMQQRAAIVTTATDIVEDMLNRIVAIPVNNDKDQLRLQVFEENYRLIIADRRRYATSLAAGKLVPYTETVVGGGPVSNVVLDFTAGVKGNEVPECSPPGELGGEVNT